jgi:hypothetical protein
VWGGVVWLVGVEEKQEPPPIEETDFFPPREMQISATLSRAETTRPDPPEDKDNGPGPSTELRERTRLVWRTAHALSWEFYSMLS